MIEEGALTSVMSDCACMNCSGFGTETDLSETMGVVDETNLNLSAEFVPAKAADNFAVKRCAALFQRMVMRKWSTHALDN